MTPESWASETLKKHGYEKTLDICVRHRSDKFFALAFNFLKKRTPKDKFDKWVTSLNEKQGGTK